MGVAFAQNLGNLSTSSATSLSGTFGGSTVSGNAIAVGTRVGAQGRTVTGSDNKSNSYTQAKNQTFNTGNELFIHHSLGISGGASHQVTMSISGAAASIRMTLHEETVTGGTLALDQINAGGANSTTPNSGNVTTTVADEWIFGVAATDVDAGYTAGAAYGNLVASPSTGGSGREASEDRIVSATGTYSAAFTISPGGDWGCAVATYKFTASGGSNKAVVPATIAGTSTMAATVIAQKTLTPATIAGVSAVSAVVRSIDPVTPATITSTSTMAAAVRSLDPVAPASVIGSSTLSVALVFKRAVGAAVITGTSVLGGTVSGGSAGTGHRHLAPSIVLTAAPAIAPKIAGRAFT